MSPPLSSSTSAARARPALVRGLLLLTAGPWGACFASAFPWPGFIFYPKDQQVGDIQPVSTEDVARRASGKSALVVGGTDGIGRGLALALAEAGADVAVVGHSAAKAASVVGNMSKVARRPERQRFSSYAEDLLTVRGCLNFTSKLKQSSSSFDYLVFTVGMWPDPQSPKSADGLDKVVALDVLARWLITQEMAPLLKPEARVLSVLGSTMKVPPLPALDTVKDILAGTKQDYALSEMLGSAGVAGDTWMQVMAQRHAGLRFIGTWPGVVNSEIAKSYFPAWLYPLVKAGEGLLAMSAEASGRLHAQILTAPNADARPVTYFNVKMEGRLTNPVAYDPEFGQWLWSFLNDTAVRHGRPGSLQTILV